MAKGIECTLIVNTANGYCFTPSKHPSIRSAVREGKDTIGFAYRIFVEGKVVKRGFCNN